MTPVVTFLLASVFLPASRDPAAMEQGYMAGDVVGGNIVEDASKWPDAAAVYFGDGQGCSGVLVAPDVVLTAGHCAQGITAVKLAATDLGQEGETIEAKEIIPYPQWWQTYDMTIVILDHAAQTPPRTIAQGCALRRYLKNGAQVAIVGYGAIDQDGNVYSSELREAYTTVTDFDCSQIERGCEEAVSPGGEIGAGGKGIDACFGDSGGPLYLITDKGAFLVGITSRSWGDLQPGTPPCREGGIYIRPDAVIDWIEAETGRDLPEPVCNLAPAPTADPIEVDENTVGTTTVLANDPDDGDAFTYSVVMQPAHGTVEVGADGSVTYTPEEGYIGDDDIVIEVSDNGDPVLTGDVDVPVTVLAVVDGGGGCGCRTAGARGDSAGGGILLLGLASLLAIGYRRRRRGLALLPR